MKDNNKTKKELLEEITRLRSRLSIYEDGKDSSAPATKGSRTEEDFRLQSEIIKNMAEGTHVVRISDGTIIYANPAVEYLFGYESGSLNGKDVSILNDPNDKTQNNLTNEIFEALSKNGIWRGEVRNVKKDGSRFHCYATVSTFHDKHYGDVAVTVQTNITEVKKAEEGLRKAAGELEARVEERTIELSREIEEHKKSEERLGNAQQIAHIGNWDWDIVKNTLYWSDEIYRIFGLTPQGFKATYEAFLSSVHPEDRGLVSRSVDDALNEKSRYSIDHRIVLPDGAVRSVHEQAETIIKDGKPVRMMGTVQDITERKRAEEESNRKYHIHRVISSILQVSLKPRSLSEILEHSLNAILSVPFMSVLNKGAIFLVEESGDKLRLEVEHGLDKSIRSMCATVPFGRCVCGISAASRKTVFTDHVGEEHVIRYDGIAPHGHYCVPIIFEDRVLGVINWYLPEGHKRMPDEEEFLEIIANTLAGIIERKRGEEEREELHLQLLQSQKLAAVARFTAGIAHDFNNLMTAVKTLSSLGSKKAEDNRLLKSYFDDITNASKRATSLTRQLSLFSKKGTAISEIVYVNTVIEENLSGIISSLIGGNIALRYDLAHDLWTIKAETSSIEQIIVNLIINAKDAMPDGGSLTIRTENNNINEMSCTVCTGPLSGRYVSFEVTDTGLGMESDTVQRIFEPFFTTKPTGKGTGLGLSVLYGIVNNLKGGIGVTSTPGEGTVFRIYLPASAEEKKRPVPGDKSLSVSDVETDYKGSSGKLILFVEDNSLVYKATGLLLKGKGYRVVGATNVAEATALFNEHREDIGVLLTDITLPDGNGIELAKKLVKIEPGLSVVFYSGYTGDTSQFPSLKELDYEFIEKPFEIPVLMKAVNKALG